MTQKKKQQTTNLVPVGIKPQTLTVLKHLFRANQITQREAIMDHGVQSLTKRISELRDYGFNIISEWKKHPITGQRYTRYSLNAPIVRTA